MSTLICNFFGGPGISKSTSAAYVFSALKRKHVKCELVFELPKELVYENNLEKLKCQPVIFGEQLWRIERLLNKVDLIITDSPIILSMVYNGNQYPPSFNLCVLDIFNRMNNINYLLERNKPYFQYGRSQSEQEARQIDERIYETLTRYNILFAKMPPSEENLDWIVNDLISRIQEQRSFKE